MQKRFILLIDFSEYSANLLKYAYSWSKEVNAEILLIHQTSTLVSPRLSEDIRNDTIKQNISEAVDQLNEYSRSILHDATNIKCQVTYYHLNLYLKELLSEPYDNLVFVGLKGTGLLKQIFIGSIAVEIIENIDNVIVAIPKEVTRFSPKKLYVPVTDKYPLNISAFHKFLGCLGDGIEYINFFSLSKPDEHNEDNEKQLLELSNFFKNEYNTDYTVYEGKNTFENIKKVINNKTEEILVVQKGSRLLTDQLFRKFLINDLVYEGQTPLVVLP